MKCTDPDLLAHEPRGHFAKPAKLQYESCPWRELNWCELLGELVMMRSGGVALLLLSAGCGNLSGNDVQVFQGIPADIVMATDIPALVTQSVVMLDNGCSGVLVGLRRVLTARHCFAVYSGEGAARAFSGSYDSGRVRYAGFGTRQESLMTWIPVLPGSVQMHPSLDLAFFDLAQDVPAGAAPAPVWDAQPLLNAGDRMVIAGFGWGREESSAAAVPGVLRYGKVQYTGEFLPTYHYATGDSYSSLIRLSSVENGQGVCPGDSGGAVFRYFDHHWGLIGIISGGTCRDSLEKQSSMMADARQPEVKTWYLPR